MAVIGSPIGSPVGCPVGNALSLPWDGGGLYLPTDGLVAAFLIANDLQDNIGIAITLTTGTIEDLPNATWGFPVDAVTTQANTDLGGNVLFDGEGVPIVRSGAEWYAIFNVDFAWIGFHSTRGGIVIYTGDMSAKATQIQNYLGRYTPVFAEGFPYEFPFTLE